MTTPKMAKLPPLPPETRCGYHNENGEQCELLAGHGYNGSDPQLVGTGCKVRGASFDGPEAAKRMRARLLHLRKEAAKADALRDSQTVSAQAARRAEIERRRIAGASAQLDKEAAAKDAMVVELRKQINDLKNDVARVGKECSEAEKLVQAKHSDWLKLRAAEAEARSATKDVQWKLDASERERTGLAELLRTNREAWNAEREALLMRQGKMLDQLDRILLREGQRARDPALRCDAQQLDRCVLLDAHEGLHDDGCGTRWGDVGGASEPAKVAPSGACGSMSLTGACILPTRHEGPHENQSGGRWAEKGVAILVEACGARGEHSDGAPRRCERPKGHEGAHEDASGPFTRTLTYEICGMHWWGATDSVDKPAPNRCQLLKGHKGSHANGVPPPPRLEADCPKCHGEGCSRCIGP